MDDIELRIKLLDARIAANNAREVAYNQLKNDLKYGKVEYPHGPVFRELYERITGLECQLQDKDELLKQLVKRIEKLERKTR